MPEHDAGATPSRPRPRLEGPHFFVDPADLDEHTAVLRDEDARHLWVVLRAAPGDPVSLADGAGRVAQAQVTEVGDEVHLTVTALHEVPVPRPLVTVVQALPKGRKLDDVVQRLSEIGVDRLVPVRSERSQVELRGARAAKAADRWRRVAHAAAKQSRRARPLEIADVGEWRSAFAGVTAGAALWEEGGQPLRDIIGAWPDAPEVVVAIGPEGGLTREEVAATGLPAATLGPTVLRTETAPLVAATIVLERLGRLE